MVLKHLEVEILQNCNTKMMLNGALLLLNAKKIANISAKHYKLALKSLELKCSYTYTMRLAHNTSFLLLNVVSKTSKYTLW